MGCDPRVWVGKGDRPCLLVVTCSGCGRPSFVADPDGAQMAACAFCGVTGKAPDEAISAWKHHKSVCKCGKVAAPMLQPFSPEAITALETGIRIHEAAILEAV